MKKLFLITLLTASFSTQAIFKLLVQNSPTIAGLLARATHNQRPRFNQTLIKRYQKESQQLEAQYHARKKQLEQSNERCIPVVLAHVTAAYQQQQITLHKKLQQELANKYPKID